MHSSDSAPKPFALRTHRPGDMGYITHRHGACYAKEYGFNMGFEALVARITADFIDNFDLSLDRCWIAEKNGQFLGCIMLVHDQKPDTAKLRLLFVEDNARGLGVGTKLIDACINFARGAGYACINLWTQSNLEGARRLYSKAGFRLIKTEAHNSWGAELSGEFWQLRL